MFKFTADVTEAVEMTPWHDALAEMNKPMLTDVDRPWLTQGVPLAVALVGLVCLMLAG